MSRRLPSSCSVALALVLVCGTTSVSSEQNWRTKVEKRDNRYEGFIVQPSANPQWELVSFTAGRPKLSAGSIIRVAFYIAEQLATFRSSTIVVARELEDHEHYRMESKPRTWRVGWNVFGPWETSDVIDTKPALRANIGVAVYPEPGRATATDVFPALLVAEPGIVDLSITSYEVVMRSSRTIASILWRLDRVEGTSTVRVSEQRLEGEFIRREPIHVDVRVPPTEGRYRLLVCATPSVVLPEQEAPTASCSDNDIERHYTFHHIPTVKVRD